MAAKKRKLNYSYSPATQELMVTTVDPKDLGKVENIMLDSDHYLQLDPKTKELVGFFVLFVDSNERKEKFHSFPNLKDLKYLSYEKFVRRFGEAVR